METSTGAEPLLPVHVIFIQCCVISIFLSLSSSGGGIPMWIGALQVVIKKTSQHTTLGFGHVSLFFLFFLITGLYLVLYLYNRGGDVSFKIYEYQLDPIPEL